MPLCVAGRQRALVHDSENQREGQPPWKAMSARTWSPRTPLELLPQWGAKKGVCVAAPAPLWGGLTWSRVPSRLPAQGSRRSRDAATREPGYPSLDGGRAQTLGGAVPHRRSQERCGPKHDVDIGSCATARRIPDGAYWTGGENRCPREPDA